jgi:hypothetical protein
MSDAPLDKEVPDGYETERREILLFVANEECTRCGDYTMVCVLATPDMPVCKPCFDRLYQKAIDIRKTQIMCN